MFDLSMPMKSLLVRHKRSRRQHHVQPPFEFEQSAGGRRHVSVGQHSRGVVKERREGGFGLDMNTKVEKGGAVLLGSFKRQIPEHSTFHWKLIEKFQEEVYAVILLEE